MAEHLSKFGFKWMGQFLDTGQDSVLAPHSPLGERSGNTWNTPPMLDLAQERWEAVNGDNTVNTFPEAEK